MAGAVWLPVSRLAVDEAAGWLNRSGKRDRAY